MTPFSQTLCTTLLLAAASAACADDEPERRSGGALKFADKPAWQERLDRIARHGLPFASLRENRESRLVVGMHPDGYFGVFLVPRTR